MYFSNERCELLHVRKKIGNSTVRVCWLKLYVTPTIEDIPKMRSDLEKIIDSEDSKLFLHCEHTSNTPLSMPSVEMLKIIAKAFYENKDRIEKKLYGTIIQTQKLDMVVKICKDIFLGLYQPMKPFDIVEGSEPTETFMKNILEESI